MFAIESIAKNSQVKKERSIAVGTTTSRLTALQVLLHYVRTYGKQQEQGLRSALIHVFLHLFALLWEPVLDTTKQGPANVRPACSTGTQNTSTPTYILRQKRHQKKKEAPGLRHTPEGWLLQKNTRLSAVENDCNTPKPVGFPAAKSQQSPTQTKYTNMAKK